MSFNYLDQGVRKRIIDEIKSNENKQRKAESLKQFEIFHDRQHQYVIEYLRKQFAYSTVKEMPVVSSVNLAKKIVTSESSIYRTKPKRSFNTTDEMELEQINAHYDSMNFDSKMLKLNQVYKLQDQALLMIIPVQGKLTARVLYAHHYDVVPNAVNPEIADAYIISAMDKQDYLTMNEASATGYMPATNRSPSNKINENIADEDDYKSSLDRYVFWSKDYNFIMNGKGEIVSPMEEIDSPLKDFQIMPFVDVALDKDFEYFIRSGQSVTDFSIQYNGALSDLGNVVKMQGWAQAYLKAQKDLIPQNLVIGTNSIIYLPVDPDSKVDAEFGFASPNPDIGGSIQYVEMLLSNFLTSRGLDPRIVSGKGQAETFSSGIERLLSMIDKFESSKVDMELFRYVESKAFEIIKIWNNLLLGSDLLNDELQISTILEDTKLSVEFVEPQSIQTRSEKLDTYQKELELGLKSRIDVIAEMNDVSKEDAVIIADQIDKESSLGGQA